MAIANSITSCEDDAEDVADKLKRTDFNVTLGCNLTYTQISVMIYEFIEKLTPEDLVVFFFSGHGNRLNEQNYLISIDNQCIVDYPNLCKKHATCVQTMLDEIATKSPSAVILLLEFYQEGITSLTETKTTSQRKSSMDFASIGNLQNSLIAYVCGANQKSLDQSLNRRNSLFTHHLLQYLAEPNLRVEDIMFHVSTAVNKDSDGKLQVQWSSNLPRTDVFLNYTTASNVTTMEIDQSIQPINVDRNTTENDQCHREISPRNDIPNKTSKIMSSTLPKRILSRGDTQTNQYRTSVAHEQQSFLLFDDRVRLGGLDTDFITAMRERNCSQSVLSRPRGYSNTVMPYSVQRLPSVAADDCDDFYSNHMKRQDTTKSRYSMSSLQDAPKIDRASTKSVDCKSAYSLDGSLNLNQSHDTSRNRPSSVGSRIDHTSSSVLDVKQTHMVDRPRSGVTKRDKKDQPTTNIIAASLLSTSSSQLFDISERTRVKSLSPSPKQVSVDTQNGITAASHIQEETVTTPIIHQDPMIMSPRLNDQTDSKNTNLLAKRDGMKHLLRGSAFHTSTLLQIPRHLSNISKSVSKSSTVDQTQRTDNKTVVDISIKATQSILPNSSHSDQDKSFHLQCIRPTSERHDDIPKIPLQSLEPLSAEERKPINILLLGQTGVGKSTFINAFANYLYFSSLQQAETGKPRVLIPVSFVITSGFHFNPRMITFGPQHLSSNETFNDQGHSVTQQCCSYTFDLPERNQRVCIIDTPGFGDTRGIQQDEINIQHIKEYITQLSYIDAICCLFKPNESKIDILFRKCFTQLFSVIGQDAYEKLMLCFTNSRSTFYAPGDTGPLLKKMLETVKAGREVKMEKNNTFCFDNEAFRFLVARQNGVEFTPNEEQEYTISWERSVKESQRLIDIILTEKSLAKQISALVRPILETIRNYLRNLILNQKNLSSDQIEVYLVKPKDISARCRKCPPCSEQISGFWINFDTPHFIDEDCIFCECSNDDHEQIQHFLRYRLKEQKSQNNNKMFDGIIEKLHSMAGIMTHFIAVDSCDSFEDPFLIGFQEMIDEETNQFRTKLNGELNRELSAQLQVQLKKYKDELFGMEKREDIIDIRRVNETIRMVKNLPMVSSLL